MSDTTERDAVLAKFYARHNGLRTLSAVRAAVIVAMADEIVQQRRRADRAERILAALREPSVNLQAAAFAAFEAHDDMEAALTAAVAAAEQEVGRE